MARTSGLKQADETVTFWHKAFAPFVAGAWSRRETPPLTAFAAPFYAGALKEDADGGVAQAVLARCLLWCDAEADQFVLARLGWYRVAARAFPSDERCVFFLAALCRQQMIADAAVAAEVYAALTRPEWKQSRFWAAFDLPQHAITDELAVLYAEGSTVSPERVAAVEAAYGRPEGSHTVEQRAVFVAYLARACRAANRRDEHALDLLAARFAHDPEDGDNAVYLGAIYADAGRADPAACRVFARLARNEEASDGSHEWTLRLTRIYVAAGRVNPDTLPILSAAARALPGDALLAAARAAAAAQVALPEPDDLDALENALGREAEFANVFAANGWPFAPLIRAVALAWGRARRMDDKQDETARALFTRAAGLFPADPTLSLFHARALVAAEQFDHDAACVYEKAWADSKKSDHAILSALGRAYAETNAAEGKSAPPIRRAQVVAVWESLHRQGLGWPELVRALAQAYTHENRAGDVALQVWGEVVADEPRNGKLRARLGREWQLRGDDDAALRWYREAAKLLPRDGETQFAAGILVREKTGDLAGAEKMLAHAARLCPTHREAHFALGETLLAQDKKEAAKSVFQTIVDAIDANHAPTLLHLGKLNLRYEDASVQSAEALFAQARDLDPNTPETHKKLADLYREKGQTGDEQRALETYLKLSSPGDADAQHQLADLYVRRGDYQSAETALRQVIALGAGDKKTYTLLGEVMIQARAKAA